MHVLIRLLGSAVALALAAAVVPGIDLGPGSTVSKAATLIAVALIFGVVNAVLKPVIRSVGCLFYVLTLGLAALVVNGLLLWLASAVAGALSLPFHISGFVAAFLGALIVSVVSWLLGLVTDRGRR
jgi:putative membrane protein